MQTNMKKLILTICFCLIASTAWSAELLVKAKPHWKDSWTQDQINKLSEEDLIEYNARSQIGDIIVVKPDGWKWGKAECLPNYIVVKIPDLKLDDDKKYEEKIVRYEINIGHDGEEIKEPIIEKKRKYQIPKSIVDNAKNMSSTTVNILKTQKDSFITSIFDKSK